MERMDTVARGSLFTKTDGCHGSTMRIRSAECAARLRAYTAVSDVKAYAQIVFVFWSTLLTCTSASSKLKRHCKKSSGRIAAEAPGRCPAILEKHAWSNMMLIAWHSPSMLIRPLSRNASINARRSAVFKSMISTASRTSASVAMARKSSSEAMNWSVSKRGRRSPKLCNFVFNVASALSWPNSLSKVDSLRCSAAILKEF
mmetsp:Transcript_72691/g.222585  ORF Transcript_72691/g.222585 Transcript_72691/m.222585 type:complete len:201 (+) Transcript_72691:920-1522(+)